MNFTFTEDQQMFAEAARSVLTAEVTSDRIRERWSTASGLDRSLLKQVQELGLPGMLVPEALGGLGLGQTDFVMMAQTCGYVACPEPIVEQVMVTAPLLVDVLDKGLGDGSVQTALDALQSGALVATGHPINPFINFAEQAEWFLLGHGEGLYLLPANAVTVKPSKSVDPSRRIAEVTFEATDAHCLAKGESGAALWRATLNRGALATAAQLVGLAQAMIDQSVRYTTDREQFGKAVGANQAVKHLLADVAVQIEYAKPVIYRAAYTAEISPTRADLAVSHAKVAAARAALLASRHCLQAHGAMGYTWECDLQIWVKRAWALAREWGDEGFHKNRIHEWLLRPNALLGPDLTFGRGSITDSVAA
jgi:alkylation response protein AidB-like acyl-CoA dehydrogenase